jgi:hypothetical protein
VPKTPQNTGLFAFFVVSPNSKQLLHRYATIYNKKRRFAAFGDTAGDTSAVFAELKAVDDSIRCERCGMSFERYPCPNCGWAAVSATAGVAAPGATGRSNATFVPYPGRLLELAERLSGEAEYEVAIIVCAMACEIATEQTCWRFFKSDAAREKKLKNRFSNFNLAKKQTRQRYVELTGDDITSQGFWEDYEGKVQRPRSNAVHRSQRYKDSDAIVALKTAHLFLGHLDTVKPNPPLD